MPIPDTIIQNDFLDNLGDDLVAVDPTGHIVGRAATRGALEHAHAGEIITVYSAADFVDPAPTGSAPGGLVDPPAIATSDVAADDVAASDVAADDPPADDPPADVAPADDPAADVAPKKSRKKASASA